MSLSRMNRRDFLTYASLATSAAVVSACGGAPAPTQAPAAATTAPTPEAAAPTATTAAAAPATPPSKYNEAPALADMAGAGTLPPVEERLPKEPMVIPVTEEIGQYGGTWHRAAVGPNDPYAAGRLSYESLLRWSADGTEVIPCVAKAYEINDDATEYTFYLREGMRWSDGEPYTADDIMFWYEDGFLNKDLTPSFSDWLVDPKNGEPVVVEKVDDYTIKMRFATPFGLFIQKIATNGLAMCSWPKHYLQQFHPTYADADELSKRVKDAQLDNWWQLFANMNDWKNAECPRIWAWVPTRVPPAVPVVWERNPYYWKVDPEGNQLPYIDDIQFTIVENGELANLKAIAGEVDMQLRHMLWTNFPLFVENAEKGNYRILQWTLAEGSNATFYVNMHHKDAQMLELYRDLDFRIALSQAINRSDIHQLAYQGFGKPRQACIIEQSPYFKPEYAERYAAFDPDAANKTLDDLGLTDRDSDGYRLRSDGTPITIVTEYAPIAAPNRDVSQIVSDNWKAIGIKGIPKEEDRSLLSERGYAGDVDMIIWGMDQCFTPFAGFPYYWLPSQGWDSSTTPWWEWYMSRGESGEEPPDLVQRMYELVAEITATHPDAVAPLTEEFFDTASEQLWYIGTVGELPHLAIVKNNFRNVPEVAVSDVLQRSPGNTNVEQYFFKQG